MSERTRFIADLLRDEEPFSAVCRRYGISRNCGYKWLARFKEAGEAGLQPHSRARNTHDNATPDDVVDELLDVRRAHPSWGPRKVVAWMQRSRPEIAVPCTSTVGAILKRHGLVAPRVRRPRPPRYNEGLTPGREPNEVWCVDYKGQFPVGNGNLCWPLTMTDLHSKFILRCQALTTSRADQARPVFLSAFQEFGLPRIIRSDNGVPFSSRAPGGLSELSVWWIKLGIRHERIEPGHPEQNGSHERMHRTLKAETTKPAEGSITAQQRRFLRFQREFNEERPHEALGMSPPVDHYESSARPYPRRLEGPSYSDEYVVRRVSSAGKASFKGRLIYCGRSVGDEFVGFRHVDEFTIEVRFYDHLLGHVRTDSPNTSLRPQ
jgi:putative transposase